MYSTEQLISDAFLGKSNSSKAINAFQSNSFGLETLNQWDTELKSVEHEIDSLLSLHAMESMNTQAKISMYGKINRNMFNGVDKAMESAITSQIQSLEAEAAGGEGEEKQRNLAQRAWDAIVKFFKMIGEKIAAFFAKIKGFFLKNKADSFGEAVDSVEADPEKMNACKKALGSVFNPENLEKCKASMKKMGGSLKSASQYVSNTVKNGIGEINNVKSGIAKAKDNHNEAIAIIEGAIKGNKNVQKSLVNANVQESITTIKEFNPAVYWIVSINAGKKIGGGKAKEDYAAYQQYLTDTAVKIKEFKKAGEDFAAWCKTLGGKIGAVAVKFGKKLTSMCSGLWGFITSATSNLAKFVSTIFSSAKSGVKKGAKAAAGSVKKAGKKFAPIA